MNIQAVEVNRLSRKKSYLGNDKAADEAKKKSEERRSMIKQILDNESDHCSSYKYASSDDDDDDYLTRTLSSHSRSSSAGKMRGKSKSPSILSRKSIRRTSSSTTPTTRKGIQPNSRRKDLPDAPPPADAAKTIRAPQRRRSTRGDMPLLNSQFPTTTMRSHNDNGSSHHRKSSGMAGVIDTALQVTGTDPAVPLPPPPQDDSVDFAEISGKSSRHRAVSRRRSCRGDMAMVDSLHSFSADEDHTIDDSLNSWSLGGSTITGGGASRDSGGSGSLPNSKDQVPTSGPPTHIVPRRRLSTRGDIVMDRLSVEDQKVEATMPRAPRRIRSLGQPPPTKSYSYNEKVQPLEKAYKAPKKSLSMGGNNSKKPSKLTRRLSTGLFRTRSDASERTEETASMSSHTSPPVLRRISSKASRGLEGSEDSLVPPPQLTRGQSGDSYDSIRSNGSKKKSKGRSLLKSKKDKSKKKKESSREFSLRSQRSVPIPQESSMRSQRSVPLSFERQEQDDDSDDDFSTHSGVDAILKFGTNGLSALEKMYDDYLTGTK